MLFKRHVMVVVVLVLVWMLVVVVCMLNGYIPK